MIQSSHYTSAVTPNIILTNLLPPPSNLPYVGGSRFLPDIGTCLPDKKSSHSRRPYNVTMQPCENLDPNLIKVKAIMNCRFRCTDQHSCFIFKGLILGSQTSHLEQLATVKWCYYVVLKYKDYKIMLMNLLSKYFGVLLFANGAKAVPRILCTTCNFA